MATTCEVRRKLVLMHVQCGLQVLGGEGGLGLGGDQHGFGAQGGVLDLVGLQVRGGSGG